MASGKPFSPSTQAMKKSLAPRFCISVKICNQNFAPSLSAAKQSQYFLVAFPVHGNRHLDSLVVHVTAIADFHPQRIQLQNRIRFLHRPVLPLPLWARISSK